MSRHPLACACLCLLLVSLSACRSNHALDPAGKADPAGSAAPPEGAAISLSDWRALGGELQRVLSISGRASVEPRPPDSADSRVFDLQISGLPDDRVDFSFSYANSGDYNQDGRVDSADLSAVGAWFQSRADGGGWAQAQLADGDGNGLINSADVTPIGLHFHTALDGYLLQSATPADDPQWTELLELPLAETGLSKAGRRSFSASLDNGGNGLLYRVVPYLGDGAERSLGIPSEAVALSSGQPAEPLQLEASRGTVPEAIKLSWQAVSGASGYELYRDDCTEPLLELGAFTAYDDKSVLDTQPHRYWLRALSAAQRSNLSLPAIGWLGKPADAPAAPARLSASQGTHSDVVHLSWQPVAGAAGYSLYRDSLNNLLAEPGAVDSYDDSAVADGYSHSYWLRTRAADGTLSVDAATATGYRGGTPDGSYVVLAYSERGMDLIGQDYSEILLSPPGSTLRATVIDRVDGNPQIVSSGLSLRYGVAHNSFSAGKTNFWDFASGLYGRPIASGQGLEGLELSGELSPGVEDWRAGGIPLTPLNDAGQPDPYGQVSVSVFKDGLELARTQTSLSTSWEVSCRLCHSNGSSSVAHDILQKHDALHGTDLLEHTPVACGSCHAQPQLGLAGRNNIESLSLAMHNAHAERMWQAGLSVECYACHPGQHDQYQRDVHSGLGMSCYDCHGGMYEMAASGRRAWVDEPHCSDCHAVEGHEYEQAGKLFKDSQGHMGVQCMACHGSPHAVLPTTEAADNLQNLTLQGHPGTLNSCGVCHAHLPDGHFSHLYFQEGAAGLRP